MRLQKQSPPRQEMKPEDLLRKEIARLDEDVSATGCAPSHEAISRLKDLADLVEARRRGRREKVRPWIVVSAAVLLVVVLYLSAKHQRTTIFVATVRAPTVHLTVPGRIDFTSLTSTATRLGGL